MSVDHLTPPEHWTEQLPLLCHLTRSWRFRGVVVVANLADDLEPTVTPKVPVGATTLTITHRGSRADDHTCRAVLKDFGMEGAEEFTWAGAGPIRGWWLELPRLWWVTTAANMPRGAGYWEILARTEADARQLAFAHIPEGRWSFIYDSLLKVHPLDRRRHGRIG